MSIQYSSSTYSNGSSSSSTAPANPYQLPNPGDVPTAVKNLLTSTKRLQEVLKLWSLDQATESGVSDVYVQIGHEFNVTISAFAYHQIALTDIHSFPLELRSVLELCLAEDPSPATLAHFMPDLRKVLFKLLKGLQRRQDNWQAVTRGFGASRTSLDSQ